MDHFKANIGINKVMLNIETNEYEEKYKYDIIKDEFEEIEDIGSIFNGLRKHKSHHSHHSENNKFKRLTTPVYNEVDIIEEDLKDKVIYGVLFYMDPTISLLKNNQKNQKVEEYVHKVNKEIELHLKEYGFTRRRITKEKIIESRELYYEYLSNLLNISLVIDNKIYGKAETCLIIENNEVAKTSDWKSAKMKERALIYWNQDLNLKLVGELKIIAAEFEIAITKMLKAEILQAIMEKLASLK